MPTGIFIKVSAADRKRLKAIIKDRNAAQKHVWWSEIILIFRRRDWHERDHASDWHVEDLRLALAGAVYAGMRRWTFARQDTDRPP